MTRRNQTDLQFTVLWRPLRPYVQNRRANRYWHPWRAFGRSKKSRRKLPGVYVLSVVPENIHNENSN